MHHLTTIHNNPTLLCAIPEDILKIIFNRVVEVTNNKIENIGRVGSTCKILNTIACRFLLERVIEWGPRIEGDFLSKQSAEQVTFKTSSIMNSTGVVEIELRSPLTRSYFERLLKDQQNVDCLLHYVQESIADIQDADYGTITAFLELLITQNTQNLLNRAFSPTFISFINTTAEALVSQIDSKVTVALHVIKWLIERVLIEEPATEIIGNALMSYFLNDTYCHRDPSCSDYNIHEYLANLFCRLLTQRLITKESPYFNAMVTQIITHDSPHIDKTAYAILLKMLEKNLISVDSHEGNAIIEQTLTRWNSSHKDCSLKASLFLKDIVDLKLITPKSTCIDKLVGQILYGLQTEAYYAEEIAQKILSQNLINEPLRKMINNTLVSSLLDERNCKAEDIQRVYWTEYYFSDILCKNPTFLTQESPYFKAILTKLITCKSSNLQKTALDILEGNLANSNTHSPFADEETKQILASWISSDPNCYQETQFLKRILGMGLIITELPFFEKLVNQVLYHLQKGNENAKDIFNIMLWRNLITKDVMDKLHFAASNRNNFQ